jgi:hypothetical protein
MERKFFTWIPDTYPEQAMVPDRLQQQIRDMWVAGATPKELSAIFLMPIEWIEDFVRRDTRETSKH